MIHLDVGTLELRQQGAVAGEHRHVEAVAMRVPHQHIPSIRYVNSIRKVGDALTPDAAQELPFFVEHNNTVALEVAHKVLLACTQVTHSCYQEINRFWMKDTLRCFHTYRMHGKDLPDEKIHME